MVVIYHIVYDLDFFAGAPIDALSTFWTLFARASALPFIFISGVSLSVAYAQSIAQGKKYASIKLIKRAITLLGYAAGITLVTYILIPHEAIYFGILHLLGCCALLGFFFLPYTWFSLITGIMLIGLDSWVSTTYVDYMWLIPVGFAPDTFESLDYFPLIPFFGVFLIGIFFGNILYPNGIRRFSLPDFSHNTVVKFLNAIGKRTLLIYLIHQPIIFGLAKLYNIFFA